MRSLGPDAPPCVIRYARPAELRGVETLRVDHMTEPISLFASTFIIASVEQSSSVMQVGRERVHLADGTVCISEPGWMLRHLDIPRPESVRVLFLPAGNLEELSRELETAGRHQYTLPHPRQKPDLTRALARLHGSLEDRVATPLEIESRYVQAVRSVLGVLSRRPPRPDPDSRETRAVRRAREQIHDRCGEKLTLSELAKETGLSRYQLFRAFLRETGIPPHAYQLTVRVTRAKALLLQGIPPAHVAADLGFYDQSHFTQCFRSQLGVTPLEYVG